MRRMRSANRYLAPENACEPVPMEHTPLLLIPTPPATDASELAKVVLEARSSET